MCNLGQWRFPNNGYAAESGLDTSDMETFKEDPWSSLAREICQNSIDAAIGEKPVKVEFKFFEVPQMKIPGVEDLKKQINACYEYKKLSEKEGKSLLSMKKSIESNKIACLRISDFNTTGIEGATTNRSGTAFYNLTKGSGVSDKGGTSGGSKGIGKFASFVVSTTNTVFYSTYAKDESRGYIGVSKLRSIPVAGDPDLMTNGIGYYGCNDKNYPILSELYLDEQFKRADKDYGTDVFIVGIKKTSKTKMKLIVQILDSFIVAIYKQKLIVQVEDQVISKETLSEILTSSEFLSFRAPNTLKAIIASHEMLTISDGTYNTELDIEGSIVSIYVRKYTAKDIRDKKATSRYSMVRYPYMKIYDSKIKSVIPFSALCVIEDNLLNKKLRAIENPQHTKWEMNRMADDARELEITRRLRRLLIDGIQEFIHATLRSATGATIDVEGAGEFLPSQDNGDEEYGAEFASEGISVSPIKRTGVKEVRATLIENSTDNYSLEDEAGEESEDTALDRWNHGDSGSQPWQRGAGKKKTSTNPPQQMGLEEKPLERGKREHAYKKELLSGIMYRNIMVDKENGLYDCIFESPVNEKKCDFSVNIVGERDDSYPLRIVEAFINGKECTVERGKVVNFKLEQGKLYKIRYRVDRNESFACEVIIDAYR